MKLSLFMLAFTLGMVPARASLLSTDLSLNYHFDSISTTDIITVSDGVEVSCPGGHNVCSLLTAPFQAIDIGAFTITYMYTGPGAAYNATTPNQFDFRGLNPGSPILAVLLSTDIVGLDMSRVTFTADSVQVNMSALTLGGPQSGFTLELVTTPEPSALSLAGLSGLGIAALNLAKAARRRA